jgi:hypothetical protein
MLHDIGLACFFHTERPPFSTTPFAMTFVAPLPRPFHGTMTDILDRQQGCHALAKEMPDDRPVRAGHGRDRRQSRAAAS